MQTNTIRKRVRDESADLDEGANDHAKRVRRVDRTTFRGNIHYVSDTYRSPQRRQRVIETVNEEMCTARSTREHIQLAIFCDASINHNETPELPGGYSVVFNEHRPGHVDHEKKVEMGWHMPHMINNTIGEAIAIAQSIQVAGEKLRAAVLTSSEVKKATVKVFTDANQVLQHLSGAASLKSPCRETFRKVLELVNEQSYELYCIPGLDVKLELFWVPGHEGVRDNVIADKVAKQAVKRSCQTGLFRIDGHGRDGISMPEAVFLPLQRDLKAETRRTGILSRLHRGSTYRPSRLKQAEVGRYNRLFPVFRHQPAGSLPPNPESTGDRTLVPNTGKTTLVEEATVVVHASCASATKNLHSTSPEDQAVNATEKVASTFGLVGNDYLTQLEVNQQLFGEMVEAEGKELREEMKADLMRKFGLSL
ncbi:hypothetical protein B0T20DRAFT_466482 [Sordaria brevicollis]|uniref:RNase H type-1 domain-containing protein n=1 Tax=Sordaria brevicollis TaxID=83679 RepID=A0AAE0PK22_SORBR|nr:hypothetical protein B0T20DRAFT_466482 [Sordaria brevicollis]